MRVAVCLQFVLFHLLIQLLRSGGGAKYCDERVCVSVCLPTRISKKPHIQTSLSFCTMLLVVVARSSSDDTGIRTYFWSHV